MAKQEKQLDSSELLRQARNHYDEAKAELSIRITHKTQGFDEYDNLYRSTINAKKWPFNSKIFIPLSFKTIYSKDTRLITGKIKGKLSATEYGSELGARIGTELLSAQYDDHDFYFEEPLVSKWFRFSQNARKYGAGFGLVSWRQETRDGKSAFDGPTFEPLDNRKVLLQPGTTSVSDSDYVIVEREATIEALETVNDISLARNGKPAYINLDVLKDIESTVLKQENPSQNTVIRGLSTQREGQGKFRSFRILTEYQRGRWITWCPDYGGAKDDTPGLVLRVVKNPYKHGLIPIIRLVYIPIDDDIYGVSELEPARSEQKATNALVSGFIEAVSTELYPVIKGHPTNVDWKTIEFKPRAAWIMANPATDIVRLEGGVTFTRNFVEAYRLLVSSYAEAMGESVADTSNLSALSSDKTATEIKDTALLRNSRDNMNKIFLSAAITKMYSFWWSMDQQFLTDKKIIKVAGKDAIEYFVNEGLDGYTLMPEGYELIANAIDEASTQGQEVSFEQAYELLREAGILEEFAVPMFPAKMGKEALPKLQLDQDGKSGFLSVESKDLTGQYRFSVDLNTVGMPNDMQEAQATTGLLDRLEKLDQRLLQEGWKVKFKDLFETIAEKMKIRNADQYFEAVEPPPLSPPGGMGQMPPQGAEMPPGGMTAPQGAPVAPEQLMGGVNVQ